MKLNIGRLAGAICVCIALNAYSKSNEIKKEVMGNEKPAEVAKLSFPPNISGSFMDEDQIQKAASHALEVAKKRTPASSAHASESLMSPQLKSMRDRFLNAENPTTLTALLKEMESNYSSYPKDLQFFAARVLPIRAFNGFVWKMIPVVSQTRLAQESAVGILRGLLEQISMRFPDKQNTAIFDYLTQPQPGEILAGASFRSEQEIQNYMSGIVYPAMKLAMERIEKLNFSEPIVMDAKLRYGLGSYEQNETSRFHFIGEAERFAVLARINRRASMLCTFLAYDFSGFIKYRQEVGKHLGFDLAKGEAGFPIGGFTREERMEVARNGKYRKKFPHLFGLRTDAKKVYEGDYSKHKGKNIDVGTYWSLQAYHHLHLNAAYANAAWRVIGNDSDAYVLAPDLFEGKKSEISEAMTNIRGMTPSFKSSRQTYSLHSNIIGRTIEVNLKNFFANPPQSLIDLLPTQFSSGDPKANDKSLIHTAANGTPLSHPYRDYSKGRAIGWNTVAYKNLYPNLKSGAEVDDYQTVLYTSRGGRLVSSLLLGLVR